MKHFQRPLKTINIHCQKFKFTIFCYYIILNYLYIVLSWKSNKIQYKNSSTAIEFHSILHGKWYKNILFFLILLVTKVYN